MQVSVKCPQCEQTFTKEFDSNKIARIMFGEHVQDVFPELSAEERELYFISHICPTCWDSLFGVEDAEFEDIKNNEKEFAESE